MQMTSANVLSIKLADTRQEMDAERRLTLQLRSELSSTEVRALSPNSRALPPFRGQTCSSAGSPGPRHCALNPTNGCLGFVPCKAWNDEGP